MLLTKRDIAEGRKVTTRTVDNWVERGFLPPPKKLGSSQQARVRWTQEQVAELDRKLFGDDRTAAR
jgi:predicted DNA-binding transcriptional regulator AlpA